jgi:hypothetical protein
MEELIQQMLEVMLFRKEAMIKTKHINLNGRLAKQQNLTDDDVLEIKLIHLALENYFLGIKNMDPTTWTRSFKRDIIERVEKIEFALQRAWKFKENRDMHSWWYKVPHCSCPYMDNEDMIGISHRYISSGCILHGDEDNEMLKKRLGNLI